MFRRPVPSGVDLIQAFNSAPNPYVLLDRDLVIVGLNDAYEVTTMRTRDALIGRTVFEAFPSDPASTHGKMLRASLTKVLIEGAVDHLPLIPYPIAKPDGSLENRFWSATHSPLMAADGTVGFILQHAVDVTELHNLRRLSSGRDLLVQSELMRRADAVHIENTALGQERGYLRSLFEQAPGFIAVLAGPDHIFTLTNAAYRQLTGHRDLLGQGVATVMPELRGQGFLELLDRVFQSGEAYVAKGARVFLQHKPGSETVEERFVDFIFQPLADADGEATGIFVQGHDVTDQKRAEAAAAESERRFRSLAQSMPNHVWTALPDGALDWFNDRVYEFSGHHPGELDGDSWASIVHEDDAAAAASAWRTALEAGSPYKTEFRLRGSDGAYRWHIARAIALKDPEGTVIRWVGSNTDIEDQKRIEEALEYLNEHLEARVEERTLELMKTQEILRHTQKMEAIGTLAGGIAHDFNNLLQVITGNLQLLAKDVVGQERAETRVCHALAGAHRGSRLASQLLAFSRRQPLEPKVCNLGRLIGNMDEIIRRSIGEAIEIETVIASGLWTTLVDPGNVENALLNLAINARDAMDGSGKLTIEAGNAILDDAYARFHDDVAPGQYVMVAVTDTGSGMPAEIIDKVFDPFFTTKAEGKGTGLGLSMVYGFVKQSGGHIKIYSEHGNGTSIKIYLPRSHQAENAVIAYDDAPVTGGTETVLVAEDDEAVRVTAVALLKDLGYQVLTAKDAQSALVVIESGTHIDLLFTDVVMPGPLRSTELAHKVRTQRPDVGILFTSGYTENSIVHGGRLDSGVNLLSKPYTSEALARKVRQVLDAAAATAATDPPAQADQDAQRESILSPPPRILLCEDEPLIRITTADMLTDLGLTVTEAGTGGEALAAIAHTAFDLLITDVGLPDMSGVDLARTFRAQAPEASVIFATGHMDVPGSEELGRTAILTKPYDERGLKACFKALGLNL